MRRLIFCLFALCLSLPAVAERKQTFGELDVHYSAFNSGFLQPDIAAAAGLVRSKTQGVVNIAVLKAGKPSTAQVSGQVKDLLGKVTPLAFRQVSEGGAIYYLAQFPFTQREMLNFSLTVQQGDGATHTFTFDQEFFPDE
ncbi:DUF4426 domain-containing protein [Pseudomonas otitidis]|uniref:DUF4426 domain-containing protein n=1 Tax=Metapseudomonas otitidis TaxID=319939 RepID=UPI002446E653|nr:DUF4426 domain-containing protein [Pseudomonas otitidis]MDH1107531.1 DUF4426 domain-containing protein [Pseudomonas otitidis]MDH1159087.1 DUF4426 domain-containing protein [Pseudomonas otitidis]MDH1166864.1 DUF4426 domain-containing protein [Pseudomonas otitidis]